MFLPILEYLAESFGPLRIFTISLLEQSCNFNLIGFILFLEDFIRFIAKKIWSDHRRRPQSHLEKKLHDGRL